MRYNRHDRPPLLRPYSRADWVRIRIGWRLPHGALIAVLAAAVVLATTSCGPTADYAGPSAGDGSGALPDRYEPLRDVWHAYFLEGQKVGFGHTTTEMVRDRGSDVVHVKSLVKLGFMRGGSRNEIEVSQESWESPAGELGRFRSEVDLGSGLIVSEGEIRNDRLVMKTVSGGQTQRMEVPWSPDGLGPHGLELSLIAAPLNPGERRVLRVLQPVFNQVADIELVAQEWEATELLGESSRLLRTLANVRMPGGHRSEFTLWMDSRGILRKRLEPPGLVSYITTRDAATHENGAPVDLVSISLAKVEQPIPRASATTRARYRVSLAHDDPDKIFPRTPWQSIRSIDGHTVELTIDCKGRAHGGEGSGEPTAEDRAASLLIQSQDPLIRDMAASAVGDASNPRAMALAIEQFVHRRIRRKNFNQAFSSAVTVASTLEGDCTEHAVLLAALARARELPARVIMGLIYVPEEQAFGYHMWNEVYADGAWLPLDATLGLGHITATHIKLAESSLDDGSAWASFLPVGRVLGQLKLHVLELGYDEP